MTVGPSDHVDAQETGSFSMDWGTERGGAGSAGMHPDESLEDFLVRVGVPPAYRVDLWRGGSAVILYLEPAIDLRSRTWTWSLSTVGKFVAEPIVGSWTVSPEDVNRVADEIIAMARAALAVRTDEDIVVECLALPAAVNPLHPNVARDPRQTVATALATPGQWGSCLVYAASFNAAELPRLGRSGPGSGMDETTQTGPDAISTRPARLHLIWWEGGARKERSWPIGGGSIPAPLAREVATAARTSLDVEEGAPVRAVAIPVAGPDSLVLLAAKDSFNAFLLYSIAIGAVAGALVSVGAGLADIVSVPGMAGGVLVSIVTGFTLAAFGYVPLEVTTPPAAAEYDVSAWRRGGGLRRLRAYNSTTVRAVLGAVYFAIPVLLAVVAAVLLRGY